MAHASPHPLVVRRRAMLAARQDVIDMGRVIQHRLAVATIAEAATRARARSVPAQRKGPARDPQTGRFLAKQV